MADDMIELHCRKCKRSSDFRRSDFADVPAWVARIEHDKCNTCDDGDRSAEHWMTEDGREPDPDTMKPVHFVERDCTVGGSSCGAWHDWFWASVDSDPACNGEDRDPAPLVEWPFDPLGCERPDICPLYRKATS